MKEINVLYFCKSADVIELAFCSRLFTIVETLEGRFGEDEVVLCFGVEYKK